MKKFIVLSKIGIFNASEIRRFERLDDAQEYCRLCELSDDSKHTTYFIAEIIAQ